MIAQMRILFCLLICAIGCLAQRPEDEVLAVYGQMEKAAQRGDADLLIGLWSRETVSDIEKIRPYIRPDPNAHYASPRLFVQGDEAALLGQTGPEQFLSMRLVREDGRWKVRDQVWSDKAFPPDSVYALVPPAAGAFMQAGAPWRNVRPAFDAAAAVKQGWQLRATFDESCLYVRIESDTPFPAPGSTVEKPPIGWPVMKVGVSGIAEFVLFADSHRPFVAYSQRLERAGKMVFQATAGLDPDPLVQVGEHFFEVRIPLRTMGVSDAKRLRITLGDAQWPKSAVFSLEVPQYR
jgi:hypothetical protein